MFSRRESRLTSIGRLVTFLSQTYIVKCLRSPAEYFAERLHHAMSGAGTDDKALVRLIVTRADRNLETIKRAYLNMYGKTLEAAIKSDTSGDYRKALLTIAGY